MEDSRVLKTIALTAVNAHILEFAIQSQSADPEWEFFCECGDPDCREVVVLTVEAYAAVRDDGSAVIALGHRLSQVEYARRLRAEPLIFRR